MNRVVFLGASQFGLQCLDLVRQSGCVEVAGVLTVPKSFAISYAPAGVDLSMYGDFGEYADEHSLPCHRMMGSMLDESIHDTLKKWKPDCLLVVGWYHMIPPSILELAPAFGLHASLLPDYSGGAPLVWAIINGEKTTGITLFRMDTGVDNGPIVASRESDILHSDTIATLYNRIEVLGLELLAVHLEEMAAGTVATHSQDESARRVFPQRSPSDGRLDWKSSSEALYNFVRAQTRPYPGAFAYCRGEKVTIWNAESFSGSESAAAENGAILRGDQGSVLAACGDGQFLVLRSVEFRGQDLDAQVWFDLMVSEGNEPLQCQ